MLSDGLDVDLSNLKFAPFEIQGEGSYIPLAATMINDIKLHYENVMSSLVNEVNTTLCAEK